MFRVFLCYEDAEPVAECLTYEAADAACRLLDACEILPPGY